MHDCPDCGLACFCNGDIDDIDANPPGWAYDNCDCVCWMETDVLMHDCPDCGLPCFCNGDIDDIDANPPGWAYDNCDCVCWMEEELFLDEE